MCLIKQSVQIMLLLITSILPQMVSAQGAATERQINMPQFGKPADGPVMVAPGETITFYDPWGTEDIRATNSYNSLSAIVFKPTQQGYAVKMDFETVDLDYFSANYPLYLNVYNGTIDVDNSYVFPTKSNEVYGESSIEVMPGELLEKLQGTISGKSFLSSSSDGALSCFFHHRNSNNCSGWVAKVSVMKLTDMEITGSGADYSSVNIEPTNKKGVVLGGFFIETEGMMKPDALTSVSFTLPVNENVVDPANLKLAVDDPATLLETTMAKSGDVYTMTVNSTLKSGENKFFIVADFKDEAAFGSKIKLAIDKVATTAFPDGISGFVAADPVEIRIPFVVLMSKTHDTYTVGADNIRFYDDGGKDGKISSKYEGMVTFEPSTQGKKIQIDFVEIGLYENAYGSSSNDDRAYVYDGRTKDDSAMNTQLRNGKPVIVKSMADDGSLTVYLKSVTGDYYIGQGFEALVSEYTPLPMTVKSVTATQITEGTVCAGNSDEPLLNVNVKTENNLAINAEAFSFNIDGTTVPVHLTKAKLFYTGKSGEFSTANKVAELDLTGAAKFEITGLSVKLVEGDNNFWLAFDVDGKSLNDEILDAGCEAVTVGGKITAPANVNPQGNRIVKNEVISVVGTVEKTIYGTWGFRSEMNPSTSYNGYNPVQGDQVTTFIPGTEGRIIELDFSQFQIYYGTSSWDTKATFKVYSGRGDSKQLLWELTNVADKNVGPGKILRSKAADGSMTVIFNAKTTSSSYTAKGFIAEVREYMSRPMAVDNVTVTQSNTNIIPVNPPAVNQDIIGFMIAASGDKNPLKLESLVLDLKGCQDKVKAVYLCTSGAKNEVEVTEYIAQATPDASNPLVTLTPATPLEISEGENYYWIAFDLKENLADDAVIDCALKSLQVSGKSVVPEAGDPEGERIMKNILIMKAGDNGVVKVGPGTVAFYDEGGIEGGITRGFKGNVTFIPATPGKVIKLKLIKWNIGGNDEMEVYFGKEVGTKPDLTLESTKYKTEVLSFAEDGSMTLKFTTTSYGSSTGLDGWEIEVSEYELQPLSLGEVKAVSIAGRKALRGSLHNMLRFDIEVLGDKGLMTVDGFKMGTEGTANIADIAKATVFATDTVKTFMDLNKFAETAVAANYELNGKYEITLPGTYRFWLQYEISPETEIGNKLYALPKAVVYDGDKEVTLPAYAQANTTVMAGFNGTYTVGKSETADYIDFETAIAAMKDGIDGPVVFEIESGEYDETVAVPEIKGTSEFNTVTFKSKTGDFNDVTIYSNRYIEPSVPSDQKVAAEMGVVTFEGADYVTFEGVTIKTPDTSYPAVVRVKFAAVHNTLRNCRIIAPQATSISEDISIVELYSRNIAGDNNDFFTVEGCTIEGGYRGVAIGSSWVYNPSRERGARIVNNKFFEQGSRAIYGPGQSTFTISGNEIVNKTTTVSFNAIDLRACFGECIISNNTLDIVTDEGATAIYTEYVKAEAEHPAYIFNNEVKIKATTGGALLYGIKIGDRDLSNNVNIVYNTVRITGLQGTGAAMFVNNDSEANIHNNIFQNEAMGHVYRVYNKKYFDIMKLSNNVLYTNGDAFAYCGGDIADFEAWKTTSGETDSYNEKVNFLADFVLEPAEQGSLLNAKPIAAVTTDIAGAKRNAQTPTIGAYEYNANPAAPAFVEGWPLMKAVTYQSAVAEVSLGVNGNVFAVCKLASNPAPAADEILASPQNTSVRAGKTADIAFDGLTNQTQYKVYYVLKNLRGVASEVIAGEMFETTYKPTKVSTFESVKNTPDGGFDDGTAHFTGCTVETTSGAPGVGNHVAKLSASTVVTLTNSDKGIGLTGFYLKAAGTVTLKVTDNAGEVKEYALEGAGENWRFINLKDKGMIVSVELSADGDAWIDDFSGEPSDLVAYVPGVRTNENEQVVLKADTYSGVGPYTYKWEDAMHKVVSNEAAYTFTAKHTTFYTLTITDAWGNVNSCDVDIKVAGKAYVATFEDVFMRDDETFWNGNGADTSEGSGVFSTMYSGSYKFSVNRHSDSWWSGHACSNITNTDYVELGDQYNSATGSGVNGSKNYCVTYVDGFTPHSIDVTNADTDSISGFYITNTAWAKKAILEGDGMSTDPDGFKKGDFFKLRIQGEASDGSFRSVSFFLADYTLENEADRYVIDTWQWVDLRSLGKVKNLTFSMSGTKENSWGLTTPTYFCMDDLNGERIVEDSPNICVGYNESYDYDLSQIADFDLDLANVYYTVTDEADNEIADVTLNGNILSITGVKDMSKTSVIVSMSQKGVTKFVRVPIEINSITGVNQNIADKSCRIWPIPADDFINVTTDMSDYTVDILGTNGATLMHQENNSGNVTIPLDLSQGVYIVKIAGEEQTIVKRIIVK